MMDEKILRVRQVSERVGLSRSTIYRLIRLGKFPPSQTVGLQAVGWRASAIEAWIDGKCSRNIVPMQPAASAARQ
jgi:prophage regulatory protein